MAETRPEGFPDLSGMEIQAWSVALESVTVPVPDLFGTALFAPVPEFTPPSDEEIKAARQVNPDRFADHLLATVLLKMAGNSTTAEDYGVFTSAQRDSDHTESLKRSSGKARDAARAMAESAREDSADYIAMYGWVTAYRKDYDERFVSGTTTNVSAVRAEINEATEQLEHPGLDYFAQQMSEVQRGSHQHKALIVAERLFRLMLLGPSEHQPPR